MLRKNLWNNLVICIPKTNTSWSLDVQTSLLLKDSSHRLQQMVGYTKLKRNMSPTKELSIVNSRKHHEINSRRQSTVESGKRCWLLWLKFGANVKEIELLKKKNIPGRVQKESIPGRVQKKNIHFCTQKENIHGRVQKKNIHFSAQKENIHGKVQKKNIHFTIQEESIHDRVQKKNIPGRVQKESIPGRV